MHYFSPEGLSIGLNVNAISNLFSWLCCSLISLFYASESQKNNPRFFICITGAIAPTTPLAYPTMPMSSPHSGATIIPTLPVPTRHPGATTFLPPQAPVYYFPTPPVSPTAPLVYPGSSNAFIRLRGLHAGTSPQEVAQFFQGYGVSHNSFRGSVTSPCKLNNCTPIFRLNQTEW